MPAVRTKVRSLQAWHVQSGLKRYAVIPILDKRRTNCHGSPKLLERERLVRLLLIKK